MPLAASVTVTVPADAAVVFVGSVLVVPTLGDRGNRCADAIPRDYDRAGATARYQSRGHARIRGTVDLGRLRLASSPSVPGSSGAAAPASPTLGASQPMLPAVVAGVVVASVPAVLPGPTVSRPTADTLQIRPLAVPIAAPIAAPAVLLVRPVAADTRRLMTAIGNL